MTREEKFNDYDGFVEKFKPKLTTDDCYTPEEVYAEVLAWVRESVHPLDGLNIVRPFWPGEDYATREYGPDDVVIDNPPFSILSKILRFYTARGVRFFLFAPALTAAGSISTCDPQPCVVVSGGTIIYANGANVRTSFVTNLVPDAVWVAGDLTARLEAVARGAPKRQGGAPLRVSGRCRNPRATA